jgi:hypothetical protein
LTALAAVQASTDHSLPAALRAHVKGDRFDVVTSIRGLPLGVRDQLQTLFVSGSLDIAEPGAAFRGGRGTADSSLPTRRLALAACSIDHCLVYYERGGTAHAWRVAVFRWTPDATLFEWGGIAPGGLKTIDDLRKAILSGSIRMSESW